MTEEETGEIIIKGTDVFTIYDEHNIEKCSSHIENLGYDKQFLQSMKKAGYHLYKNNKKIF